MDDIRHALRRIEQEYWRCADAVRVGEEEKARCILAVIGSIATAYSTAPDPSAPVAEVAGC